MSGKRYTDEFKSEAAKQVVEQGRSVREVSGRLGISIDSLVCRHGNNQGLSPVEFEKQSLQHGS